MMKRPLLIATHNQGKLEEFRRILGLPAIYLVSLSDLCIDTEVEEQGETFNEIAAAKARAYALISRHTTLADDSGLVIDALDGRPGIFSARYAGESGNDLDRIDKVLRELRNVEAGERTARFVCALSLSDSYGEIVSTVTGACEGEITFEPRGENGFGYDPIFQPGGFMQTFAELDSSTKDRISHRALAAAKIIPFLQGFFDIRLDRLRIRL
jgi:XTP/dITP diphosphohydrolase